LSQHFKTVVLWLGLRKRWPLCTTVLQGHFTMSHKQFSCLEMKC